MYEIEFDLSWPVNTEIFTFVQNLQKTVECIEGGKQQTA